MCCIRIDNKYDFEELSNILLRNGYKISVEASMINDDGNKMVDDEIAFYIVEYADTRE